MNSNELLHLKRGIYRLKGDLVKNIIGIGVSPFLMNVCACVVVIFMNNQFVRYGGDWAVGSYGIANAIGTVFLMFIMGLNQGMQPIAGYNYGSQQIGRLERVLKLALISAVTIMTIGWLIAMILPYHCARIFTDNETLANMSARAIRIDMFFFPFVGFQMVITNFFQCIEKVKVSIFLSLSRQLLFLIPLLYILPLSYGIDGVWYSLPASDLVASIMAGIIIINVGRQIGSGGGMIARMLADEFGCKLYDKELLNLAARESGFSEALFEQNDEQKGFFKSLFHVHVPLVGENNFYRNNISQESLYQFQSDAIKRAADEGSSVFVGRTADYVLREYKNAVSVFITANMEQRIQNVCKRHNLTSTEARKYICKREDDRTVDLIASFIRERFGDCFEHIG